MCGNLAIAADEEVGTTKEDWKGFAGRLAPTPGVGQGLCFRFRLDLGPCPDE